MGNRTKDRASAHDEAAIFTVDKIGTSRERTPEGFLLCRGVPFARAGVQLYGEDETPIKPGKDGIARVRRTVDELFRPETLASFNGKPIVNDHPEDDVSPENWKKLAGGIVLNPRPGTGEYDDCIVGDFLITDKDLIDAVEKGKVETSAGYDADYEDTEPGEGLQTYIIGNHVALVERGRCGPRCAIGDRATVKEKEVATARVKVIDRRSAKPNKVARAVRAAFKDAEAAAMEAFGLSPAGEGDQNDPDVDPDAEGDDGQHIHVHLHEGGGGGETTDDVDPDVDPAADPNADPNADPGAGKSVEDRVSALEAGQKQIIALLNEIKGKGADPAAADPAAAKTTDADPDPDADPDAADPDPEGDDGKRAKTGDSVALADSYQGVVALAELLAPGIRVKTFDSALPRAKTIDAMCQLRRKALDMAYATEDGHEVVNRMAGKTKDEDLDLGAMDCKAVAVLFKASAGARSLLNNRATVGDGKAKAGEPDNRPSIFGTKDASRGPAPKSLAELNTFYAKHYGRGAA